MILKLNINMSISGRFQANINETGLVNSYFIAICEEASDGFLV